MGKKSKKTKGNEPPSANVGKLEPEDTISETNNSTDSVKKSKKKNRKRDLNGTIIEDVCIESEEINDSNTLGIPTTMKIKKEKNKKHTKLLKEELSEEIQNDTDTNKLHEDIPKKKKKKDKLLEGEDKSNIETCVEVENHKPEKDSKKKKNKNSSLNEPNADKEKVPKIKNEDTKQKKGKNKARTGVPILNDEESQVTEEDIDRFIDELDEEDNKQYEDWVKLLDDRLSKKQKTE